MSNFIQSFGTLTALTGQVLTPEVAFSSLSLFNILQDPLFLFPMTLFLTVNGAISTGRIATFLAAPEVNMKTLAAIKIKKSHLEIQGNGAHTVSTEDLLKCLENIGMETD